MNSTPGPSSSGSIVRPEIGLVGAVDLGRDLQRNAERARNRDGAVGPLLRRDAAEKGDVVAARPGVRAMQVDRQAVIDGRREIRVRHRAALIVGDRNQRHVVEAEIERQEIGQVLAAMQGGDGAARDRPEQRELELIDMEVQDVEVVGALAHAIEHQHVIGDRIEDAGVEPQRLGHAGHEIGGRDRIAAGKQRDVMAERDELFGQVGDDPLGAAIKPWRHALDQRRDLRDFHWCLRTAPRGLNPAGDRRFHDMVAVRFGRKAGSP